MKAVVLAAGAGTRLASLDLGVPKPLAPIGQRPLLDYSLGLLRYHGFRDIAINLWHMGHRISERYGDGNAIGLRIRYLVEESLSGTAGAVRKLADYLQGDDVLVFYGDLLTDINLTDMLHNHVKDEADVTIAVHELDDPRSRGVVWLNERDEVIDFIEKPAGSFAGPACANAGIYMLRNSMLDDIPDSPVTDFGRDVFPIALRNRRRVRGYRLSGFLCDIGQPHDYEAAQDAFQAGKVCSYVDW